MTDFIMAPAIVGICTYGFYKFVELLAHRKERLVMIDKLTDNSLVSKDDIDRIFASKNDGSRFVALRFGALFAGIGLGLLLGFVIVQCTFGMNWVNNEGSAYYRVRETIGVIYGASTLVFGGIGLLISFVLEQMFRKQGR